MQNYLIGKDLMAMLMISTFYIITYAGLNILILIVIVPLIILPFITNFAKLVIGLLSVSRAFQREVLT